MLGKGCPGCEVLKKVRGGGLEGEGGCASSMVSGRSNEQVGTSTEWTGVTLLRDVSKEPVQSLSLSSPPGGRGSLDIYFFFFNIFKKKLIYLFYYLWLCWVFVSVRGLSLVAASRGHSSSRCAGLSLSRPLLLRGTGSGCAGSVVVAHGPSCSAACGILPDRGSNPCPLHW